MTASAGVATFTNLRLNTAGSYTLSEKATNSLTGPVSSSFTVTPAAVSQLVFGQQPTTTTAGLAIAPAVTVRIEDLFGNLLTSDNTDQVTIAVASGPGGFAGGSTTTVTVSAGVATFNNLVLDTAGSYTLSESATSSLNGPVSSNFTIAAAAVNQLAFGVQPANTSAGAAIAPAVTVKIEDQFGNLVTSDNSDHVTLAATGPGSFTGASTATVTANAGIATFSNLHLNTAGSYALTESATNSLSGPASSSFAIAPAAASQLVFGQQPTNTTAGAAITPAVTVKIEDAFGNLVSSDSTDQVTLNVASGPGNFAGASTATATVSDGVATFNNLVLNTAGSYTLSETASGGLTGPASSAFSVTPAAANQLVFAQQPTNTAAGAAIAPAVTVKIEDPFGNLVTTDNTDQVTLASASGPGTFAGTSTTTVTASGGIATFNNLILDAAGSYTLSETASGGISGPASTSFTVAPAAASELAFGVQPTNTTAGSAVAPAVTVKIEDQFGNVITADSSDQVTLAVASGPGSFTGTSTATVTASARRGHLQQPASEYGRQLHLERNGHERPVRSGFQQLYRHAGNRQPTGVRYAADEHDRRDGDRAGGDGQDRGPVRQSGRRQQHQPGDRRRRHGPGSFTGASTSTATASGGIATFSNLILNTAGSYTLSEHATGSLSGPVSTSFLVTPAAASQLMFGVQPTNTIAGSALAPAVTVKIEDAFGNLVTADNTDQVTVAVATGPGSFTGASTATVTASGGVATFNDLILDTAGSYTLSETASGPITGPTSGSFSVAPTAANQLVFGQQPTNTTAGVAITPAVTAKIEDQFGNVVTSDNTDPVTLGVFTGPGNFAGTSTTTVTASGGVAVFNNLILDTAGSYTLSETVSGLSGTNSSSFTVTPATANRLAFGVQPTNTTAGTAMTAVSVKIEDAFGNLLAADSTDQVTLAVASGPGIFSGASTTAVTASGGSATFHNLVLHTAGSYTLSATLSGGVSGPASSSFAVTAAAAAQLGFGPLPTGAAAGAAFTPAVTIKVEDQFGNVIAGDNTDRMTVGIASGPGAFTGSSTLSATVNGGVATFQQPASRIRPAVTPSARRRRATSLSISASSSFTVTPRRRRPSGVWTAADERDGWHGDHAGGDGQDRGPVRQRGCRRQQRPRTSSASLSGQVRLVHRQQAR